MKFRIFDKRDNSHYFDAEYLTDCFGELFFHDLCGRELWRSRGEHLIVQHSTGLTDDSGKEIFEGDWVKWEEAGSFGAADTTRRAQVVFSPSVAAFVLDVNCRHPFDDKYGDYQHMYRSKSYKII